MALKGSHTTTGGSACPPTTTNGQCCLSDSRAGAGSGALTTAPASVLHTGRTRRAPRAPARTPSDPRGKGTVARCTRRAGTRTGTGTIQLGTGWGFPLHWRLEVVAAQQEHQAPPRQPRGRRRRPRTHKGELGTVIPNIPTIPPPDQRDTASPDVLVCAYICMRGTAGDCGYLPNTCLAPFSTVNSGNGQPGTDRVDRTVTACWQVGRKDFAPQACTLMTGAAGTHSAGTLATAYQAAVYLSGYTGVGAFFATGDARRADQQRTAQDGQTGMSYMASTRPSTVRGQTDRQQAAKATGRVNVPAVDHAWGWQALLAPTRQGPWPPTTLPLYTPVWARSTPPVTPSLLTSDRQYTITRQECHIWPQTGHQYAGARRAIPD